MFDFYEKRKIRSIVYSWITVSLVLLLCLLLAVSVYKRYAVEREMADRRVETEIALQALKDRAAVIEGKVDELSDARGLEAEIRNRFDVAKEGEQVVVILDTSEVVEIEAPVQPVATSTFESFFSKLKFW